MTGTQTMTAIREIHRLFAEGTLAGLSDDQLLDRFAAGRDAEAFAALVGRHGPMVLGTCRAVLRDPDEADDAFQAAFLVLARKAGSIRDRQALGGWLHRVSRRVAVQANAEAARRRAGERHAALNTARARTVDDDLASVLHEEIDRLPDRHRLPLVLCHLEELAHTQAARQLRWSERTLRRRLAEARDRLRRRLTGRGLAFSLGDLAVTVPETLSASAVRAATVSSASSHALAWAAVVARGLSLSRLKTVATVVLAVELTASVFATCLAFGSTAEPAPPPESRARSAPTPKKDDAPLTYRGRVLDPAGKPFAGAKIVLDYDKKMGPDGPPERTRSDADGRFSFRVDRSEFDLGYQDAPWENAVVVAVADGFGLGLGGRPEPGEPWTLRLADDLPVSGRLLDPQGKPIAGVSVKPESLFGMDSGNADYWIASFAKIKREHVAGESGKYSATARHFVKPVVTGPDGQFRLSGLGRERLLGAYVEGPNVETAWVWIVTRRTPDIQGDPLPGGERVTVHGAVFDRVARPSQAIVGVVRDVDTGLPVEGAEVQGNYPSGSVNYLRSVTDREGRYRLTGLLADRPAHLTVEGPKAQPYARAAKSKVPNPASPDPTVVNFAMKRGLWIEGKVTDHLTGKPVRGQVNYFAFDSPAARAAHMLSTGDGRNELRWTKPDGSYRVVGLPGRGLIAFKAHDESQYSRGVGAEKIAGLDPRGYFSTYPSECLPINYHAMAGVDPREGALSAECDLTLDPGRTVKVSVLDPEGKPLAGSIALGSGGEAYYPTILDPMPGPDFDVVRVAPGRERKLTVIHDGRKLSGGLTVTGNEPGPVTLRLKPWGVVTGRLVDANGEPRAGNDEIEIVGMDRPRHSTSRRGGFGSSVPVDGKGRFRIEGLVAGRSYTFLLSESGYEQTTTMPKDLILEPGEVKDLGDVKGPAKTVTTPPRG